MNFLSIFLAFEGTFDGWIESMVDVIYGGETFTTAIKILSMSPQSDLAGAWGVIVSAYNTAILPVGYTLLTLYFLLELMDRTTNDNFNMEHFLRMFIKLIIGNYLMTNGLAILSSLMNFSSALITDVGFAGSTALDVSGDVVAIKEQYMGKDVLDQVGYAAQLLIPYIITFVVRIVIWMQCFSRLIEILVRAMVAPIAMADVFSEGIRGGGFRYLRKYLAVLLQGVIIIGVLVGSSALATHMAATSGATDPDALMQGANFITQTAIQFTTVTLVGKSQSIANDLVGV